MKIPKMIKAVQHYKDVPRVENPREEIKKKLFEFGLQSKIKPGMRIAITAESPSYCFPCGTCRQVLLEFAPDIEVLCARGDGRYVSYNLRNMMSAPFTKEHLG